MQSLKYSLMIIIVATLILMHQQKAILVDKPEVLDGPQ